jgi:hypothetical protein
VHRVDDDGAVVLESGKVLWNHSPDRLRATLQMYGLRIVIAEHGPLKVPQADAFAVFSVADGPTGCRGA